MNEKLTNENEWNQSEEYNEVTEQELLLIEQQASELEARYKAEMEQQTPDLWERIEANLPEKSERVVRAEHRFKFRFYHVAASVAALLVLVLGVPLILSVSKGSMDNIAATPSETADAASDEIMSESASDEIMSESAEVAMADEVEYETTEEAVPAEESEMKYANEESAASAGTDSLQSRQESEKVLNDEAIEESVSVLVEIVDNEVHCVTIKILEDESGRYTINKQYSAMIDMFTKDTKENLKIGTIYQVDLKQVTEQNGEELIYLENPIEKKEIEEK